MPLAIGIAVMLLAGLPLLPALTSLTGRAMFPHARPTGQPQSAGARPATAAGDGWWGRVAARVIRRPGRVLGAGVLVLGALALAALGYHPAGLSRATTAPAGSDAAAGNALLARYFPQSSASPSSLVFRYKEPVWQHPSTLTAAQSSLSAAGGLTVRYAAGLRAGPQQSTAAMDATPAVRTAVTAAARRSGAVACGVAGQAAGLYDLTATAGNDMVRIIPVAMLAIAIVLALVLRSLIAPLYLVVSIVLSYLAALGLTTVLVIDIGGQGGLVFVLPFLMFVFGFALGHVRRADPAGAVGGHCARQVELVAFGDDASAYSKGP